MVFRKYTNISQQVTAVLNRFRVALASAAPMAGANQASIAGNVLWAQLLLEPGKGVQPILAFENPLVLPNDNMLIAQCLAHLYNFCKQAGFLLCGAHIQRMPQSVVLLFQSPPILLNIGHDWQETIKRQLS